MLNALKIELLKSHRTQSFSILFLMMVVAILWQSMTIKSAFAHAELREISTLFSNQTVDSLLLPIMVSTLASKLISNEKTGQTFKLQQANGTSVYKIFYQKLLLMLLTFFLLFLMEGLARYIFGKFFGMTAGLNILLLFLAGQLLSVWTLLCFFLTLSILLDKQGLVLACGFLFGFCGVVFGARSAALWSFMIPSIGNAYLAPFKYHTLSNQPIQPAFEYLPDQYLLTRFVIYTIFSLLIYLIVRYIIKQKGEML